MNSPSNFFISENNVPFIDYFKFGISVDCVIFGYDGGVLKVLLIESDLPEYKGQ
mgnify:CR=1 FL=1